MNLNIKDFTCFRYLNTLYGSPEERFRLCSFREWGNGVAIFKESFLWFLNTWWRLVSIEPIQISSISIRGSTVIFGAAVFPESFYSFPVYRGKAGLGFVRIWVDREGNMTYMDSDLIPQLRVPDEALISEKNGRSNLKGYRYTGHVWGGYENRVFSTKDIAESALEVYPHRIHDGRKPRRLEYRLAWRFTTSDGYFFVDSQTGEIIGFVQPGMIW